ncbi:MAG: phosphate signaling complex protein PhoU [Methanoregula sp.]|nr:phosphate signaling complex protein PhoU [Methanoregula sp.]
MAEKFHTELSELRQDTLAMARFSRNMLHDSIVSFMNQDAGMAKEIVSHKRQVRETTIALEERTYQLIALNQPMARDMRVIACTLKIITSAERIGRYGKDIANMVRHMEGQPDFTCPLPLKHMADQVIAMIDDTLTAYETEDLRKIAGLSFRDDAVDSLWHSIFRETLTFMMENPKMITRSTYSIMVARYLERSGDHACRMAENIHYMVTGERIEIK